MTLRIIKFLFWGGILLIVINYHSLYSGYVLLHNAMAREYSYAISKTSPMLVGNDFYCSSLNLDKDKKFRIPVILKNDITFSEETSGMTPDNSVWSDKHYDFYFGGKLVYKEK